MRNIDSLIREARKLSPRNETDFRLIGADVRYVPDPEELLQKSTPDISKTVLKPGQSAIRLKLYGRDSGSYANTIPVLIDRQQIPDFLRLIRLAFPNMPGQGINIISLPVSVRDDLSEMIDLRKLFREEVET